MATQLEFKHNNARILDKISEKLGWTRGTIGAIRRRAQWSADGAPAVDIADRDDYPVKAGDLAWDYTNGDAYICTVAPTGSVNATFVKLHA